MHLCIGHTFFPIIFFKKYRCDLSTRHTCKIGLELNGDINTIALSSCMTKNEHIITGISDDVLNN